jgi:hypothetical protein
MIRRPLKSSSTNDLPRCKHQTASGRRCLLRVSDAQSPLCFRHTHLLHKQLDLTDLAAELAGELVEFKSAAEINHVLSRLLILLSQSRISPRRAAVIAYIGNLLLRTIPAIEQELQQQLNPGGNDSGPVIIIDVPRPKRD